jgi:hypothetical protein
MTTKLLKPNTTKKWAKPICLAICMALLFFGNRGTLSAQQENVGFTQADRDRIIRIENILGQHEKQLARIEAILEQDEKRLDQIEHRMEWQFGILISALFILVGFILWDRRTFLKPFQHKVETIEEKWLIEKTTSTKVITALRELAKTDTKLAEILKNNNLL